MTIRLPALLAPLLMTPAAYAHHSFAPHFDIDKPVDIAGRVVEYEARNPHSYVHIEAVDEQHSRAQQEHPQLQRADGVRVDDVRNVDGSGHVRCSRFLMFRRKKAYRIINDCDRSRFPHDSRSLRCGGVRATFDPFS